MNKSLYAETVHRSTAYRDAGRTGIEPESAGIFDIRGQFRRTIANFSDNERAGTDGYRRTDGTRKYDPTISFLSDGLRK